MSFNTNTLDLPHYRSIRLVRAARITDISCPVGATLANVTVQTPSGTREITVDMRKKPSPEPGWWLIAYDDGYLSFCPPDSFEKGYQSVG